MVRRAPGASLSEDSPDLRQADAAQKRDARTGRETFGQGVVLDDEGPASRGR